ncbi:lysosomal alpha-mannosidase-like [Ornithodoros turicata]|uniref:lysosomal alpha-mannosidase-like n=1 Tax=Ornithodoros turicata TaxID=34597 RepID=UPI00313869BA
MLARALLSACCVGCCLVAVLCTSHCEEGGCPTLKPEFINVHVIPHSHNDAGWLHPLEYIYRINVRNIYNSSIRSLLGNQARRYVSAENVFFSRWWHEQDESMRKEVRNLVSSGRLQFVGGGWVQNDEAVTHYTAIIDQMTLGLRFLNETFGECGRPTVAWQADPFGHSRNQANLFALMGFNGLMIGRISMDEFAKRSSKGELVFVWRTGPEFKSSTDILTWVPPKTYTTPDYENYPDNTDGIAFNQTDAAYEDPASRMGMYSRALTKMYPHTQVGFLYGDDLTFTHALNDFTYLDGIVRGADEWGENNTLHVVYSTPGCYVNALHATNRTWTLFDEDFFPYTDKIARTWAGFFTSRPTLKYMVRYSNGFLQACKQLSVAAGGRYAAQVRTLKEAVATLQHHDGITGTCTDTVAQDYMSILMNGIQECEFAMKNSISFLLRLNKSSPNAIPFTFCHNLNISQCPFTEKNKEFVVLVYNPMSRAENVTLRFPISERNVSVTDSAGEQVQAQVVDVLEHRTPSEDRKTRVRWELAAVVPVPALGFSMFHVTGNSPQPNGRYVVRRQKGLSPDPQTPLASASARRAAQIEQQEPFVENNRYRLVVNATTGLVSRIHLLKAQKIFPFHQTFQVYKQLRYGIPEPSGHYVFAATRPPDDQSGKVTYKIVKGPVVQEIHQIYNDNISQVIRLYKDIDTIEFQWTVGPVDMDPASLFSGADVITKYETDLKSDGVFYTDGNGRQNMKRQRKASTIALPAPSNYYPVVSWIYIEDKVRRFRLSVIPDRPQGGSSLRDGVLELMVHRRHETDDRLGIPECLNEVYESGRGIVVTGKHKVFFGTLEESVPLVRLESLRNVYVPVTMFASASNLARDQYSKRSILRGTLPEALHLLTLEPIRNNSVLLRLEHLGAVKDAARLSVNTLLGDFELEDIQPALLGANRYVKNAGRRFQWKVDGQQSAVTEPPSMLEERSKAILSPGEIQTFVAHLKHND